MRFKIILSVLGSILKHIGFVLLLPVIFALFYKEYNQIFPFVFTSVFSIVLGSLFTLCKADEKEVDSLKKTEALTAVFFSWVFFGLVCAIPYLFYNLNITNALFEAVSGITTTGATILTDFSLYPKTFFFFRSLTQWLGGMGIIVLFVAILPKFAVAGRQMFYAEAPGPTEEKVTPRIRHTATWLWTIYIGLTFIEIIALKLCGLDFYNAVCNSFTSLAAGGFSPNPQSIAGYHNDKVTWIISLFMFLAGTNFILQYKILIQHRFNAVLKSEEFWTYFGIVGTFGLLTAIFLIFKDSYAPFAAFTDGVFQIISLITSTGFASVDFTKWNVQSKIFLFAVMFIGSCASSTGGGIKVVRWIFIFKYLKRELAKLIHPSGVYPIKLEGAPIGADVAQQMMAFVIFYFAIYAVSAFIVGLIEQNTTIALSAPITCIGNIGPGFGSVIGPMGSFDSLSTVTKWILTFNMLIGRLELIPFLALLHKDLWTIKK